MVDRYESKAPGVYIEEITPTGPIEGAGTTVAALVGKVAKDDATPGKAVPISNWTAFTDQLGGYKSGLPLPYAVRGFFENGGTFGYVVPVKGDGSDLDGALDALTRLTDVSMVCLPGTVDSAAQSKVITHCEQMGDRFAILDGAQDDQPLKVDGPLRTQRAALLSKGGYGALYWPWIRVSDPADIEQTVTVPPSGHIAGVLARSDDKNGVHKAPANEPVVGAVALDYDVNGTEHGQLNKAGINTIRRFPGGPPLVWGARTLTDGTAWRYVNVRRLFAYVEDSILTGLRWAVFAPNSTSLWKGLERTVAEFLTRVWQAGGLFGRTAKEAFYVRIDEELNPPAVRALGQVIIEVGLAPTRPAEFVVVRIGLWDGGARISEG